MFAFIFRNNNDEFDIYRSEFIGDRMTLACKRAGITAIIYVAM